MGLVTDMRPLIERGHVKDTFAHDLGRVDVFETDVRLVLFTKQYDQDGGPPVHLVGRGHKIVMPKHVVVPLVGRVLFALGHTVMPDLTDLSRWFH